MKNSTRWDVLPKPALVQIFIHLPVTQLISVAQQVNKRWYTIARSNIVWAEKLRQLENDPYFQLRQKIAQQNVQNTLFESAVESYNLIKDQKYRDSNPYGIRFYEVFLSLWINVGTHVWVSLDNTTQQFYIDRVGAWTMDTDNIVRTVPLLHLQRDANNQIEVIENRTGENLHYDVFRGGVFHAMTNIPTLSNHDFILKPTNWTAFKDMIPVPSTTQIVTSGLSIVLGALIFNTNALDNTILSALTASSTLFLSLSAYLRMYYKTIHASGVRKAPLVLEEGSYIRGGPRREIRVVISNTNGTLDGIWTLEIGNDALPRVLNFQPGVWIHMNDGTDLLGQPAVSACNVCDAPKPRYACASCGPAFKYCSHACQATD